LLATSVAPAWRAALRETLDVALRGTSAEERVLVARDRPGGGVTGAVLFGETAGVPGAGRLRAVVVTPLARRRGVGRALVEDAVARLAASGARFVMAEVPDEPDTRYFAVLLEGCGFREEARAADLVRDGVAMRYLRRDLTAPHESAPGTPHGAPGAVYGIRDRPDP
jgi:ribosomal protein S18 acetylase RimI-like enzyme